MKLLQSVFSLIFKCTTAYLCLLALPAIAIKAVEAEMVTIPLEPVQPSLWWSVERFEQGLVENLIVDTQAKQVRITINNSLWLVSDYLRRYAFLQKLGSTTATNGYGVLLQDSRKNKLAEYVQEQGSWHIEPAYLGTSPFRVNRPNLLLSP